MNRSDPALVELARWAAQYCLDKRQERLDAKLALDEGDKTKPASTQADQDRRRRIAEVIKAAAAHYQSTELTDEQLTAELIRRAPDLKPAGRADWWRTLCKEVAEIAKECGVALAKGNAPGDESGPMSEQRRRQVVAELTGNKVDDYMLNRGDHIHLSAQIAATPAERRRQAVVAELLSR